MIKSLFARNSDGEPRAAKGGVGVLTRPRLVPSTPPSMPPSTEESSSSLHPETAAPLGRVPRHVAIIMDGNGRWARQRNLPRTEGHRRGVESVRAALKAAGKLGVEYLNLFSFSSENWHRSAEEISDLMGLLRLYLRSEIGELNKHEIRLQVIGNREKLPSDIVTLIERAEAETREGKNRHLILALSYGSREEILHAARSLAKRIAAGEVSAENASEADFAAGLFTSGIPDPDLIIRTSGEQRLSNFLLFQSAYSELVFIDCLWPDFGEAEFSSAVAEFSQRERRFGK